MNESSVILLSEIRDADAPRVGAKALSLARLLRGGLPVPGGFVVTTGVSADSISRALDDLGAGRLAVRSSATAEDLPDHAFAGMYETVLDVAPEDVPGAIEKCYASARSKRAVAYMRRAQIKEDTVTMAVIVQRLVPADLAGVAFTADPVTGEADRVIIEAVRGAGDPLVGGRVTPGRVAVDGESLDVVERTDDCCLSDAHASRVARLALRAAEIFGSPQDVEWAAAGGEVFLLQSRPVTTGRTWEDRQVWSSMNVGEVLPDVVTPATWSFVEPFLCAMFGPVFGRLGISLQGHPIAGTVAGRVYFNINTLEGMFRKLPMGGSGELGNFMGGLQAELKEQDVPELGYSRLKRIVNFPGLILWILGHLPWSGRRFIRQVTRENDRLARIDLSVLDDDGLYSYFYRLIASLVKAADAMGCSMVGMGSFVLLREVCRRWLGDDGTLVQALMAGVGGLESAESGIALWELAGAARCDAEVLRMIESGDGFDEIEPRLETMPEGRAFLDQWNAFMFTHGHHARGEIELGNARWSEQPDLVLSMLRHCLKAPGALERYRLRSRRRKKLERRCRRRLDPIRRAVFNLLLGQSRGGGVMRETIKSQAVRRFAEVRRVLMELGRRMADRGQLEDADDIFFLRIEEIRGVFVGKRDGKVLVAERRREYEANLALRPPPVVVGRYDPDRDTGARDFPAADTLEGLGVSPGAVTGRARVIMRHDDDERVGEGEILVAPFTDPGWVPQFLPAAGIVMDLGGMLSHGSIIAREYGIPAVVNVGTGTRVITTGMLIRVDGDRGVVSVLEPEG